MHFLHQDMHNILPTEIHGNYEIDSTLDSDRNRAPSEAYD